MTERLVIQRDWGNGYETKTFTLEQLLSVRDTLGMDNEQFSEFITGLTCDSYADQSADIMADTYAGDPELCFSQCMEDEEFLTCYTVYRLWNPHHTDTEALEYWKDSCLCTLEDLV